MQLVVESHFMAQPAPHSTLHPSPTTSAHPNKAQQPVIPCSPPPATGRRHQQRAPPARCAVSTLGPLPCEQHPLNTRWPPAWVLHRHTRNTLMHGKAAISARAALHITFHPVTVFNSTATGPLLWVPWSSSCAHDTAPGVSAHRIKLLTRLDLS